MFRPTNDPFAPTSNTNLHNPPNNPFAPQSNAAPAANNLTNPFGAPPANPFTSSFTPPSTFRPAFSDPFANVSTPPRQPTRLGPPDPFAPQQHPSPVLDQTPIKPKDPFAASSPHAASSSPFGQPSNPQPSNPFNAPPNNDPFNSLSHQSRTNPIPSDPFAPQQPKQQNHSIRHGSQSAPIVPRDPFASSYSSNPASTPDMMMDSHGAKAQGYRSSRQQHHPRQTGPPQPGDPFAPPQPQQQQEQQEQQQQHHYQQNQNQHHQRNQSHVQPPPRSQLFLRSVPEELFDRDAIIAHFASGGFPPLVVQNVSLRKNRYEPNRRTAIITFANEADATRGLEYNMFNNQKLPLTIFRTAAERVIERAGEPTNELLFSHIPEEQFSETSIRNLFNNLCPNSVTNVSTREKPTPQGARRTAIITFVDIQSASTALKNLPSYRNMKLQVVFRQKPQHLSRSPMEAETAPAVPSPKKTSDPFSSHQAIEDDMEMDQIDDYEEYHPPDGDNQGQKSYPTAIVYEPKQTSEPQYEGSSRSSKQKQSRNQRQNKRDEAHQDGQPSERTQTDSKAEILEARQLEMEELRRKIKEREEQNRRLKERKKQEGKQNRESRPQQKKPQQQQQKRQDQNQVTGSEWRKGERVNIDDAVLLVGTCQMMCPEGEIDERTIQKEYSEFETSNGLFDPELAVKKYRRSAALSEQPIPEDVRPPKVLARTMNHLKTICDSKADFVQIHHFVRDRTRSLRQDFTLQGVNDNSCIRIHEESVRFHILSEHRLFGVPIEKFSAKQNREQLDKCLISLREMYDLRRERKLPVSPNEPEMQSYYLLTHMSEPKKCVQLLSGFAPEVRRTKALQFAFKVVFAASSTYGNPATFFACVREAPYLTACLLHHHFTSVRANAILMMNDSYGMVRSLDHVALTTITERFGFESNEEATSFCKMFKLKFTKAGASTDSESHVMFPSQTPITHEDVRTVCSKWKARRAVRRIESKARSLKPSEIISGKGGVVWKAPENHRSSPKKGLSSPMFKEPRKRLLRRLQLQPYTPDPSDKVHFIPLDEEEHLSPPQPKRLILEDEEVEVEEDEDEQGAKGGKEDDSKAESNTTAIPVFSLPSSFPLPTNQYANKTSNFSNVGSSSKKRSPSHLGDPFSNLQDESSPAQPGGAMSTPKSKNKVRFSENVYYEGEAVPPDSKQRSPKRIRVQRILSSPQFNPTEKLTTTPFVLQSNTEKSPKPTLQIPPFNFPPSSTPSVFSLPSLQNENQSAINIPPNMTFPPSHSAHSASSGPNSPGTKGLLGFQNTPPKPEAGAFQGSLGGVLNTLQPNHNQAPSESLVEFQPPVIGKVSSRPNVSVTQPQTNSSAIVQPQDSTTSLIGRQQENVPTGKENLPFNAKDMNPKQSVQSVMNSESTEESMESDIVASNQIGSAPNVNDVTEDDVEEEQASPSIPPNIMEFVEEINECVTSIEANVTKMRKRTHMTEEMYVSEHQECIQMLDSIKEVAELADDGLQRIHKSEGQSNNPDSNVLMKTRAMLVPSLRKASLLWDEMKDFFMQAESQLRTVKLKLISLSGNVEGINVHALEPVHDIEHKKPVALEEMEVVRPAQWPSLTYRSAPRKLNELTDIALEIIKMNIRCWQVGVINMSSTRTVANRWVQMRLSGWFRENTNGDTEVLKLLEVEPHARDRYVSVVSGANADKIPATVNAVVATIDICANEDVNKDSIASLRELAKSLKQRAAVVNMPTPCLVVVCLNMNLLGDTVSFEAQLKMELRSCIRAGWLEWADGVKLSGDEANSFKLNQPFTNALLASVRRTCKWEVNKGLALQNTNVFEKLVQQATFAWKNVLVNYHSWDNIYAANMDVIKAINDSWKHVRLKIKEQEVRWPSEIRRRKQLSDLCKTIETLKLPAPSDVNAESTEDYINHLVDEIERSISEKLDGVKVDYEDENVHPLWQFCLALHKLIPSYVKKCLCSAFTTQVVPLPIGVETFDDMVMRVKVEEKFLRQDRQFLGVLKKKTRAYSGSAAVRLQSARESIESYYSYRRSRGIRESSMHGKRSEGELLWKRIRLPRAQLSWRNNDNTALGDGQGVEMMANAWTQRRNSLDGDRNEMRKMYDELIREGEEYAKVIDESMMQLQEMAREQSSICGNRRDTY